MDRKRSRKQFARWLALFVSTTVTGCVTTPMEVPTIWDKLGVTGASARFRDATLNRSGKFPGLEKKPPLLRIADPANLAPEKPEVIKAAAKIKQDQDLKKQKIKAIKFLAEVNCGCYNKDDEVAKAFLDALGDCDPDVKKAAVEAICTTSGNCSKCRTGCETSCCTQEIVDKLNDIASGKDEFGCYKEPSAEIRGLAAAAGRKCSGQMVRRAPEELPAPPPTEIEELVTPPERDKNESDATLPEIVRPSEADAVSMRRADGVAPVAYQGGKKQPPNGEWKNAGGYGLGTEKVSIAKRRGKNGESIQSIVNTDHLIQARVINNRQQLGEVLLELPDSYSIAKHAGMVVVDSAGSHQVGQVIDASGRRVLLGFDSEVVIDLNSEKEIRIGLIGN